MKKLTDEEWERLLEILHALRHGKKIQTYFADEWREDDDIELYDLFRGPLGYQVRPEPETVTIHVIQTGKNKPPLISNFNYSELPVGWKLLYSFEHEVWQ